MKKSEMKEKIKELQDEVAYLDGVVTSLDDQLYLIGLACDNAIDKGQSAKKLSRKIYKVFYSE